MAVKIKFLVDRYDIGAKPGLIKEFTDETQAMAFVNSRDPQIAELVSEDKAVKSSKDKQVKATVNK